MLISEIADQQQRVIGFMMIDIEVPPVVALMREASRSFPKSPGFKRRNVTIDVEMDRGPKSLRLSQSCAQKIRYCICRF